MSTRDEDPALRRSESERATQSWSREDGSTERPPDRYSAPAVRSGGASGPATGTGSMSVSGSSGSSGSSDTTDSDLTMSLFEALQPVPTPREAPSPQRAPERRGQSFPTPGATRESERAARAPGAGRRPRPQIRRVKRTLRHVDPISVLKLSLFYAACFLVLWAIFIGVIYGLVASTGFFDAIEETSRKMELWKDLDINLFWVERWALLVAVIFLALFSLLNLLIAFLYNVGADLVGGVEMTFAEREA